MNSSDDPSASRLGRLVADAARLSHAREAVLSCGTGLVARWSDGSGSRHVIATQPFSAGSETYELNLLDERVRELTATECSAFQALVEAFVHELERTPAITRPEAETDWVQAHVVAALDYVTDSFILLLKDWTIQHVNTQFERTIGRQRAELIGRNLWQVLPELLGTKFEAEARAARDATVPRVFEEFSPPLDRWFESRAYPCKDGLAILTMDITERKREAAARAAIEQKLLRAQRMESLGTLASGIAHDFNNIVGAILGHAGLMRDALPQRSAALENLDQICAAGERARELVQQILTYSRPPDHEFVRQPLRPLIEESLRLLRATLPASVRLTQSLAEEPLATTLDRTEAHQLVTNLCINAWHALPADGGDVEVELRRVRTQLGRSADVGVLNPGLYAQLVVRDTGCGMSEATRQRLFEPFFTTKPRGQGTGLGLHVLSRIVAAHQGAVVVTTGPGRGSEFAVYLPATTDGEAAPSPAPPRVTSKGRGERVAYVDDDEVVQLMVRRILERAGLAVTAFSDPQVLLQAVRADPRCFDLLVTDYSMPGLNGLQVARLVRAACPKIPIIIATGFATDELKREVERLGQAQILNKELTFEELGQRAVHAIGAG